MGVLLPKGAIITQFARLRGCKAYINCINNFFLISFYHHHIPQLIAVIENGSILLLLTASCYLKIVENQERMKKESQM